MSEEKKKELNELIQIIKDMDQFDIKAVKAGMEILKLRRELEQQQALLK